ncbi:MAG TPA: glycosyltransferase [Terriglobales bacterium]|nr:glycosyltransferase [Terriglobales bacterium]
MHSRHSKPGVDVLFAMNNMAALGIQRVITWIINEWPPEYGECALSLHNKAGDLSGFLRPDARVFELDSIQKPLRGTNTPSRVLAYYKLLQRVKPRTVIVVNQFEALALCLVKRWYSDFRLVVCEHCHVSSNLNGADAHSGWFGWYYRRRFRSEYLRFADVVHTVSQEAAEDLATVHGIPPDRIRVIYNPVDVQKVRNYSAESVDHPWLRGDGHTIVAACRLANQKRLDILLNAFALLKRGRQNGPAPMPARLIICGEGPQRGALERMTTELGLADSVCFVGFQENPWKWIGRATAFVSTSEWEGLPCSLIEAQALGVPVVSSDCPSGPREILLDGEAGFLFRSQDITAAAQAITFALQHADLRKQKAQTAIASLHRFEMHTILRQYAELAGSVQLSAKLSLPNDKVMLVDC